MTNYAMETLDAGMERDLDGSDERDLEGVALETPADIRAADRYPSDPISGAFGQPNIGTTERLASGLAGAALTSYALSKRRDASGAVIALAGGYLLFRGISGQCMGYKLLRTGSGGDTDSPTAVIPHHQGIKVEKAVSIQKDRDTLYDYWRNFQNLPLFMRHLESVSVVDDNRSHWVAKGPLGKSIEWDAEIINEIPGEMIAWRSTESADIANAGSVWFKTLPAGRGTMVKVNLEYNPPAGVLGAVVAKLFGEEPNQQVRDDLRRFKSLMEAGEVPTIEGQPQGNTLGHSVTIGPLRTNP